MMRGRRKGSILDAIADMDQGQQMMARVAMDQLINGRILLYNRFPAWEMLSFNDQAN